MIAAFHQRLLEWWAIFGRHDLPWQIDRDPYRVWVSEIMLQQTQVITVIDYFGRFMARFPTLQALARADMDEVLVLWTGLGYYARARNLHKAARQCISDFGGQLPTTADGLLTLPGIGRSTAHAIIAQAHNTRAVILDGNVKRVLARHRAIEGWPGRSEVEARLWQLADDYTPHQRAADYTQAIMDLGATVCTRTKPNCAACPVAEDCLGRLAQRLDELPTPKPKSAKKTLHLSFMVYVNSDHQVWLEKRPSQGIWGGLWCFPTADNTPSAKHQATPVLSPMEHLLTHRVMKIRFYLKRISTAEGVVKTGAGRWYGLDEALTLGLPRPIEKALGELRDSQALVE